MNSSSPPLAPPLADPAATIPIADAATSAWGAIIVGAGPAGGAAAVRLASQGCRVLLVDAATMPRPKLCGCCLSPAAVRELERLDSRQSGEGPLPPAAIRLARVRLVTQAVSASLPLPGGHVVSREALDQAGVRRAIAAGAAWLPGVRVASVREPATAAGSLRLELAAGPPRGLPLPSLRCDVVIVASGLATSIRIEAAASQKWAARRVIRSGSRIGVGTVLPRGAGGPPAGELLMAVAERGYCGIVRLEDGRLDLAAAIDREWLSTTGSPAAAVAGILAESGGQRTAGFQFDEIAPLLQTARFRGTPPLTGGHPLVSATGRIVHVGDAAGYVEPFTGEGMGWALASARLIGEAYGPALAAGRPAADELFSAADRYASSHRRHFSRRHARCRLVALAVRRPWLVRSAAWTARLAPAVAARIAPLLVGAASARRAFG